MKKNMGKTDKLIRLGVVIIIALLNYFLEVPTPYNYILLGLAVVFLITSFLNFCPLYTIFGINTCSIDEKPKE